MNSVQKNKHSLSYVSVIFLLFCFLGSPVFGQGVKISQNKNDVSQVNPSAILELSSTGKGLLLPRVQDTLVVANPVAGLMVYQIADNKTYYYNGTIWVNTASSASSQSTTANQNLSQVLAEGNSAGGESISNVDSLTANGIRINPSYVAPDLDESSRLLVMTSTGRVVPIDIYDFFKAKVYKKSYTIAASELNSDVPDVNTRAVIYYTYKAYGARANDVTFTYKIAQSTDDPLIYGRSSTTSGESNFELTIPEGVEMRYFHFTVDYSIYNRSNSFTAPKDLGARFHIIYQGADRLQFNSNTGRTATSEYPSDQPYQDPQYMNDFYMPIMKAVFFNNTSSLNDGTTGEGIGMGYIDDHLSFLQFDPSNNDDNIYEPISGTAARRKYFPFYSYNIALQLSPTAEKPLVRFKLLRSQDNRMIIGMHYVNVEDPQNPAIRISIFF